MSDEDQQEPDPEPHLGMTYEELLKKWRRFPSYARGSALSLMISSVRKMDALIAEDEANEEAFPDVARHKELLLIEREAYVTAIGLLSAAGEDQT